MIFQAFLIASGSIVGKLAEGVGGTSAPFNPSLILFFQECFKFVVSTVIFFSFTSPTTSATKTTIGSLKGSVQAIPNTISSTNTVARWKYAFPALMYSIANQAMFHVLVFITPAEFVLLWNTKIIFTAGLHYLILKRKLSPTRTLSLLALLIGIVMTEYTIQSNRTDTDISESVNSTSMGAGTVNDDTSNETFAFLRILAALASIFFALVVSFANVYTEHIYKKNKATVWEQNMMLYGFGILCNIVGILLQQSTTRWGMKGSNGSFSDVWIGINWWCLAMIVIGACSGLITGLILKYIDVIFVVVADACAVVLNIALSALLFGLHITFILVVGTIIIMTAIIMYQINGENDDDDEERSKKGMIKLATEDEDDLLDENNEGDDEDEDDEENDEKSTTVFEWGSNYKDDNEEVEGDSSINI
jgi:drug/metabolite transporter (DMT)-like permease